jgi:prepilin-type N-terminal cleavage/methylation domain-containing protein
MRNKVLHNLKGFTLIELLVATAVMGLLAMVSANIISSVLKSQNKTTIINEIRQNGDSAIARFERDAKQARGITPVGLGPFTSVTLDIDGVNVVWACQAGGAISRDGQAVTNNDPIKGVQWTTCGFSEVTDNAGQTIPQVVTLRFTMTQAANAPGRTEFEASEDFQVTVGTRAYTTN